MRMTTLLFTGLIAAALAACTIEQKNGQPVGEFHPPLTYPAWQATRTVTPHGRAVCVLTSGYNGLTLTVPVSQKGHSHARSNRVITPGNTLTVTVAGNRYQTSQADFSTANATALVHDFFSGDKAYAEWTESNGSEPGVHRVTMVFRLDDFRSRFNECKAQQP